MKKFLAILLSVLCIFSMFSVCASAKDLGDIVDSIGGDDKESIFGVQYTKTMAEAVVCMYEPLPTVKVDKPGYVRVTSDTPIAVDHDFVCWEDNFGNQYRAGDYIYVNKLVELHPVWSEKTDNHPRVVRVIICAMGVFQRMFQNIFNVFKKYDDITTQPTEPDIIIVDNNGNVKS